MNQTYLLFPIGIVLILLYLLTGFLVRINLISNHSHHKIWNLALLITFLVTVILGVFLAVQTNYKFECPLVKILLKWHVDFGIAMSLVAIFHLSWHLKYYLKIFEPPEPILIKDVFQENRQMAEVKNLKVLILLSGFLSTSVQVLLIREITTVFQGNELMMSWTLGAWMLLTGLGALLGRSEIFTSKAVITPDKMLAVLAFFPVVLVVLLNVLKTSLFMPGTMVGPAYFLLILIIFLSPVCLLSGFIYSFLVNVNRHESSGFTKVYAFEAAGSLIGGLVVSFAFVKWFSVILSLLIMLLLVTVLLTFIRKDIKYLVAAAGMLAVVIFSGVGHLDIRLKSFLFVNQKVLESRETYFGNITITENAGQYNFFGNGSLLYTTENAIASEEYTHYALMQHAQPKDVLLVSGGIGGMVAEILKYNSVENVDYVELNPQLINMALKYAPLPADKRIHLIFDDGRRMVQRTGKKYDVVIFAVPDPSSLQVNRFYTDEFLSILKKKLNDGAVILYGISTSGNYMSAGQTKIETTIYHTLKNRFQNVVIIPGERNYFIASDAALRIDIAQLSAAKAIGTKYVNPYYIDDISIRQRGEFIRENLKEKILNLDEKPLPVYFHSLQFISGFTSKGWQMIVIPLIIMLLPLFFLRSVAAGMYISGFTASSFEILIIFSFQTFFGYVYSVIGLIVAVFMGGLAVGSLIGNRFSATKNQFVSAQMLLFFYCLLFPYFWNIQKTMATSFAGLLLFSFITLILSSIVGFQYVVGTKILPGNFTKTAPLLYSVDLIGAALGAIAVTVILLPLLGIIYSCLLISAFNFIIALINGVRKN